VLANERGAPAPRVTIVLPTVTRFAAMRRFWAAGRRRLYQGTQDPSFDRHFWTLGAGGIGGAGNGLGAFGGAVGAGGQAAVPVLFALGDAQGGVGGAGGTGSGGGGVGGTSSGGAGSAGSSGGIPGKNGNPSPIRRKTRHSYTDQPWAC